MSVFIGYPSFMAYQMMKGKKGNNDGFPSIPGMIARYSALGLTNEQMAANPVWKDLTGNRHDLQMKNFAWGGMSGVGGYVENYNRWTKSAVRADITFTDHSFNVTSVKINQAQFYYQSSGGEQPFTVPSGTVIVKGLTDGQVLEYIYTDIEGRHVFTVKNDGIYTLPSFEFIAKGAYYGFQFNKVQESCNITIEQLPLYPDALVFDGVDDYGVCENFPILTKEKGYTVVALRQWIEEKNSITALVSNSKNWNQDGAFVFEYNNLENNFPNLEISFGGNTGLGREKSSFTYQTSKLYNGKEIKFGEFLGSDKLTVAKAAENLSPNSNVAIWELVFLDHDATEEELTKIKDYFVKTYPWLFPDQAWTVVGKTNEDEDRATIANITGNGNDLVLSNFGFSGNSGYGLYQQNYAIWTKVSNRATFTVTSSKIHVTSVTAEEYADFIYTTGQQLKQKIRITGLSEGVSFVIGRSGVNLKIISQDGIYDVDILDDSSANPIIGYRINKIIDSCDITIEQIPEYEGYLITDGVDDRVQDSSFKLNKDWTLVGEWVFLNQKATNAGITKPFSFIVYNRTTGLSLFINTGTSGITIENVKSIKAICSDGRIYLDDWSEMLISKDQNITSSTSVLSIGFNGTAYTQIAFKNLGIYNNQILSKEDCIKAYNYLQTLKAK